MTQDYKHLITPPPEQIGEWWIAWDSLDESERPRLEDFIAEKASQYSADQELEACCLEIIDGAGRLYVDETRLRERLANDLRAARRPKPPSLKEQALEALDHIEFGYATGEFGDTIRRALEQLDDPS